MPKESQGLISEKKFKDSRQSFVLQSKDQPSYNFYIDRFEKAKDQRNQSYKWFDDMNYEEDYITNENAKNTYLEEKENDAEVRVNTGTTEKKIEVIQNELLTMNVQHEIRAYDQNDLEIAELGADIGDIVTRTNQVEKDDDFWIEAITELLTQRAVFVEEFYNSYPLRAGAEPLNRAEKRLISGLKMYIGDITIPCYRYDEQPYIIKYDRVHWKTAERMWADNANWKYVKAGMPLDIDDEQSIANYTYRFGKLAEDEVEIITYFSLPDNEYQVMVNGVLMFEPGTELPYGYAKYNIRMYVLKSLSTDFAYGRPLAAAAKTLQALNNETIRLLILKFQQALQPPLAVPSGKIYSRDIWAPGAVTQGLKKADFERLIDHDGVTGGEMSMYRLIEEKTEEFIGAGNIAQGLATGGEKSATEILQAMKQFTKQLGLAVYALTRMKRDLTELRIYTLLENYLDPIKKVKDPITQQIKNVYRSFTVNGASFENERRGTKVINLTEEPLGMENEEKLYDFEEEQAKLGNNVRIKYIDIRKLQNNLFYWYVIVTAQEKEGTALDKVIFQDKMSQAVPISQISGRPLAGDKIIEDFERTWKAKDWFQKQAPQALPTEQTNTGQAQPNVQGSDVKSSAMDIMKELQGMEGTTVGGQIAGGLRRATPTPSVERTESQV